jgi:hypothetical protein
VYETDTATALDREQCVTAQVDSCARNLIRLVAFVRCLVADISAKGLRERSAMKRLFVVLAVAAIAIVAAPRQASAQTSCTGCGQSACCIDPSTLQCTADPGLRCQTLVAFLCGNGSFNSSCGNTINCGDCSNHPGTVCTVGPDADHICCSPGSEVILNPDGATCCTPSMTCSGHCGSFFDGCIQQSCGSCPSGQSCVNNTCCTQTTCAAQGAHCGSLADGCGGTLNCGTCPAGQHCSSINQCVANPPAVPASSATTTGGLAALLAMAGWGLVRRRAR